MIRSFLMLFLAFSTLFALTPKDTIVVAVENESTLINPVFTEDHDAAIGLIFSGLTRFDENMQIQPDLAKSWQISKDGLKYSFVLRDDVVWHDGVKFSAKDVKFTLESLQSPKLNAPSKVNFDAIKSIKIIDDTHIEITLSYNFPAFLDALSIGMIPKHLLEGKDLNTDKFNQNPIGTGAFKFQSWKKGDNMVLVANENFYRSQVKTPKLILKTIPDPSVTAIELKNGNVDVGLVDFNFVKDFEKDKNFKVLIESSADYRALSFNLQNAVLQDKNVRKALNYLIQKEMLIQSLLHGLGEVANQPLQRSWASPKTYPTYDFNPSKAQELLAQAGWVKNQAGIYEKNGLPLSFEMYAMSNDPLRVALVTILQAEFKKYGILTKVITKPSGSFEYDKVDSFLVGWGSPYDPDFHTYRVFGYINGVKPDWNFSNYNDSAVNKALKLARSTNDNTKRKEYYAQFINALYENPPFLFLVYLDFPLVYNKNISGIKAQVLGHHGVGFTWNAYEWSK